MDVMFFGIVFGMMMSLFILVMSSLRVTKAVFTIVLLVVVVVCAFLLSSAFFNDPGISYMVIVTSERIVETGMDGGSPTYGAVVEPAGSNLSPTRDAYQNEEREFVLLDATRPMNEPVAMLFFAFGMINTYYVVYISYQFILDTTSNRRESD